jgi:hypothetical protein
MNLNKANTAGMIIPTSPNSTTLTTTGTTFSAFGNNYSSGTSIINNPLEINGPIIYNNDNTTYVQSYLHEVAVIAITRSPEGYIIKSKMVKTMWVETKDKGSIDFAASKDPEVEKFEPEDIIIKTLRTIKL